VIFRKTHNLKQLEAMKHLKDQITYTAEKTARSAQVRIATRSPQALIAVHEFLRFQIKNHRTGRKIQVASFSAK
jgi:hypothetical protein